MANNSSGARSVLYGKTIDHVLEQEVVLVGRLGRRTSRPMLADGGASDCAAGTSLEGACYRAVHRARGPHAATRSSVAIRRCCGASAATTSTSSSTPMRPVNLAKLMVGSEGTLGVVLSAKLNLVPLPRAKAVLAIQFASLSDSLAATPLILQHRPSAVEVMDRFILDHTRQSPALHACARASSRAIRRRCSASSSTATVQRICRRGCRRSKQALRAARLGYRYRPRDRRAAAQAKIWTLREAALGLSMAMKGDAKSLSFVEDTAVAPERLRDYIERFLGIVQRHGTSAGIYAHASVGCLHVRPVVNMKTEAGVRTFEAIANEVSDLVLEYGGALSGEHGDGLVRSPFMRKMFGPELYDAFRTIKRTFDPERAVQSRQDRRRAAADGQPALRTGVLHDAADNLVRLRRRRRHGRRRRDVQRPRRLPQDPRRHDVSVVHGHARGAAHDARPGGRAAPDDGRPARRSRPWRPRRLRDARSLSRVPGVQGRVPGRRRRGAVQERVSRRLLEAAWHIRSARECSAMRIASRCGAADLRRCRTARIEHARTPHRGTRARHRSPTHGPAIPAANAPAIGRPFARC